MVSSPLTALQNEAAVPDNLERFLRKGRQLLNLRVDYNMPDQGLVIGLWATNVLDENYQSTSISSSANGGLYNGFTREPRMYGINIRKSFGGE